MTRGYAQRSRAPSVGNPDARPHTTRIVTTHATCWSRPRDFGCDDVAAHEVCGGKRQRSSIRGPKPPRPLAPIARGQGRIGEQLGVLDYWERPSYALPPTSRARHCVRSRRWVRRPCRARRHRADHSVPGRRPPHGAGERGGGVAREDAIGASGGLRAAAARYVRGVAVPPGTVRDTEAARRRTNQRRSSSAPQTMNGKGATKSSSSAVSAAVPSSA